MPLGLKITNINIMAQLKVKQISDFVSAVATVHNGAIGTQTQTAITAAISSAESKDVVRAASANSYADTAEADAIASAESKDVVRATAANSYADQAEADAIASAESKDVVRATAANSYADAAEADAIASAASDATSKVSTALSSAVSADVVGLASAKTYSDIQKTRVDAILNASAADKDSFAEIVTLINSVDTTNDNAVASVISDLNAEIASTNSDVIRIDAAIVTAQAAAISAASTDATTKADAAESDAIASAESKDVLRATTAVSNIAIAKSEAIASVLGWAESKDVVRATAANTYADAAEADAVATAAADATSKDDAVLVTLRAEIAGVAGTDKIEQLATFASTTSFTIATGISDVNSDILVYVNGLQVHRTGAGIDGFSIAAGGTDFQVASLGYNLESTDHIVVIGVSL